MHRCTTVGPPTQELIGVPLIDGNNQSMGIEHMCPYALPSIID